MKGAMHEVEWKSGNCILIRQGECPATSDHIMQSLNHLEEYDKNDIREAFVSEMYLAKEQPEIRKSLVAEAWQRVVGDHIIPYDLEERRHKFEDAYKLLAPYIAAHEAEGPRRNS